MGSRTSRWAAVVLGVLVVFGATAAPVLASGGSSKPGKTDIRGNVTSWNGREAGVWVIAETDDLGTLYRKIVVTDEKGRYLIPDLPKATYDIWVRGYGLVDAPKVRSKPGSWENLTAVIAPNEAAAAEYYPANYWLSLLEAPPEEAFPTDGFAGQADWIQNAKSDLIRYQWGTKFFRELHPDNPVYAALGLETTLDVLRYMEDAGQMPEFWPGRAEPVLQAYADWIDSMREGALPPAPPRPQGVERNLVLTEWDNSTVTETPFIHDILSSDKRDPTVNGNGKIYGSDFHNDSFTILDPVENTEETIPLPSEVPRETIVPPFTRQSGWANPSPTWGDEIIARDHQFPGHQTMDGEGNVWVSAAVNVRQSADWCSDPSSDNPYVQADPLTASGRDLVLYEPGTEEFTTIRTCFTQQHVEMAVDGSNRVFTNSGNSRFGWLDTDLFFELLEETGDKEQAVRDAQGWCRLFYDADGDGDADRDFPVMNGGAYGPYQSPVDGSVWGAVQAVPGRIIRLDIGDNPPETCVGEMYEVPFNRFPSSDPEGQSGFFSRGIAVDTEGVVWTGLASSGHLASFDRRKCEGPLTGPEAMTGRHCPEGWTLHETPGPKITNTTFSADWHYYNFVDQHGVFGLGKDTPMVNGTNSDSILALVTSEKGKKGKKKKTTEWVTLRVPYPLGFYTRGMDVRIDDPKGGWKGRGLWAGNASRAVWHSETGLGTHSWVTQFQLRPNPLAG